MIGEEVVGSGILTGKWIDSDAEWMTTIAYQGPGASILVVTIPEPGTLSLLLIGGLTLLRRKRSG